MQLVLIVYHLNAPHLTMDCYLIIDDKRAHQIQGTTQVVPFSIKILDFKKRVFVKNKSPDVFHSLVQSFISHIRPEAPS